jgi:L,D-peptidoglycan transpeptidase YkuD (ErfK/YbiS/YcfS/YnhG family)
MQRASVLFLLLAGCGQTLPGPKELPAGTVPDNCSQVVIVRPTADKVFQVQASAWERGDASWHLIMSPTAGVIGRKGFAPPGEKREGDGRTPTGAFRIGTAFGAGKIPTGLDFRLTSDNDFWVDDPESPQYNRWVTGPPQAKSFEKLRQKAYVYAAIIEYNTNPVVPGNGSAIFLHVWAGSGAPTSGCVAMEEGEIMKLLRWLDKKQNPVIVLNP